MKLTINDLKPRITVLHMIKNHILDDSFDDLQFKMKLPNFSLSDLWIGESVFNN